MIEIHNLYTGYSRDETTLSGFNYNFDNKIYGILGAIWMRQDNFVKDGCRINQTVIWRNYHR